MNAHTWIPAFALMALFALAGTSFAAIGHKSTMQMSKKDARAIVEGRRTKWNSLHWGEPSAVPPPQQRIAPAEVQPASGQEAHAPADHHHHEFLDLVAATGEVCLAVVVLPVVVVAAVVVFPLHCLAILP